MRVLLDECLPARLKTKLEKHEVKTVPQMDWAGKKNGELLRLAQDHFDVFVTVDQNLIYQQNLQNFRIAVVILVAQSSAS